MLWFPSEKYNIFNFYSVFSTEEEKNVLNYVVWWEVKAGNSGQAVLVMSLIFSQQ